MSVNDNKLRLMQLERELDALDRNKCSPMSLSQLDGFLTGIVIHPYSFDTMDWAALVFNPDGIGRGKFFNSKTHASRVMDRINEHTGTIAAMLDNFDSKFEPIFEEHPRTGEIIWSKWIAGFDLIAGMHAEAWDPVISYNENSQLAFKGLKLLAQITAGNSRMKSEQANALKAGAHFLIPEWIVTLNQILIRLNESTVDVDRRRF